MLNQGKTRYTKRKFFLPAPPREVRNQDGSIVSVSHAVWKIMRNDDRRMSAGRWFSGRK